jgi:DNA-binding protein HU-beta
MNKSELVHAVSNQVGLSQDKVVKTIDAIFQEITQALKKGDRVLFIGFGTFIVGKRGARKGRNPKTGASVKFKAGKDLREAVKS